MAALPSNSTDRWFLDYVTGNINTSKEHTMSVRLGPDGGVDGAASFFLSMLNGIGAANLWAGWKALRLRHQAAGTNFSVPAGLGTTLAAFVGTGVTTGYTVVAEALEMTVQGRSYTTGRRGDISLYGVKFTPSDFRYAAGSGPTWNGQAWYDGINGLGQPAVTVDGSQLVFYPYVNFNYNSYWEGAIRRG
jgi:hypothetical protein